MTTLELILIFCCSLSSMCCVGLWYLSSKKIDILIHINREHIHSLERQLEFTTKEIISEFARLEESK